MSGPPVTALFLLGDAPEEETTVATLSGDFDWLDCTTALSAGDALDTLSENDFDCLISAYELPGMEFVEFVDMARETDPELPVVLYADECTEEVLGDALEERGLSVGEDVFLAFSPERIDPGNEEFGPTDIPKVLGGVTPACGDRAAALYEPVFDEVVRVESATEAELVKLLENTFRAVNIGLINELAQVAHELDIDIWHVIDAAATKPFGFMPFYPGPGLGGHCIPIDPFYLSWKASEHGVDTRFIDLADTVNREMPPHIVERVVRQLNERGIAPSRSHVLIVGAAYKPNVSDTRESPAIDIIHDLEGWGATVEYYDPNVPTLSVGEATYESVDLTDDRLTAADCVVVVTNHDAVDVDHIVDHASFVFDARNATDGDHGHVVRL
jgi:UDP-N-acetyl-D-glucosamine dehydrogenase